MGLIESECNKLWADWKKGLSLACAEIEELAVSSEEEFISLGNNLYNISSKAKDISGISLSVADLFVGEKTTTLIEDLKSKLNNIDNYFLSSLNELSEDVTIIEEIQNKFVQIKEPFREFKRIIKHLNILSISTRIKSASLKDDSQQFNVLAEDIIKLTDNAEIKIKNLSLSVESSNALIQKLFSQINELKNEKYLNTRAKLEPIQKILDDYKENQRNFDEISKEISTGMIDNSAKVNNIVTSLQFHDITRQKIEHVQEELSVLLENGILEIDPFDENQFTEKSKHVDAICRIQNQQLNQANNEITTSVDDVQNRLVDIKGNIAHCANLTNGIVNSVAKSNKVILEETGQGIDEITHSLLSSVDANVAISDTIREIINTVEIMIESTTDINSIGANIQILAFNGLIHASQIGEEGASLGVIADAIQQLSTNSQNQIVILKDFLENIGQVAEQLKLRKTNDSGEENSTLSVKDISHGLIDFFNQLKYINTEFNDRISEFNNTSNNFTIEINNIVSNFTIGDKFNESISNSMSHLDMIIEQSKNLFGDDGADYSNKYFDEMKDRYTMDTERDILDEYLTSSGNEINQPTAGKLNSADNELDDNVELF